MAKKYYADNAVPNTPKATVPAVRLIQEAVRGNLAGTVAVSMLDRIYPIGSLYISMSPTSPASLFGGGWKRLDTTATLLNYSYADVSGTGDIPFDQTNLLENSPYNSAISSGELPALPGEVGGVYNLTRRQIPMHNHLLGPRTVVSNPPDIGAAGSLAWSNNAGSDNASIQYQYDQRGGSLSIGKYTSTKSFSTLTTGTVENSTSNIGSTTFNDYSVGLTNKNTVSITPGSGNNNQGDATFLPKHYSVYMWYRIS